MGRDMTRLSRYYSELFRWEINTDNPMNYGIVDRAANVGADGIGTGGSIDAAPEGYDGHVTFYVGVDDVEAALAKAESLSGARMMGAAQVSDEIEILLFHDPHGHLGRVV